MAPPKYAVIVVTYQRPDAVGHALEAVCRQTVGRDSLEICVVNNGGSDGAREAWAPRVEHWIDSTENLGCAGGRNAGVAATSAPIVCFVDDDGIAELDFIERLAEILQRHPDAVAVRGRAIPLHHPVWTTMAVHYDRGPVVCQDLLTLEGASAVRRDAWEACGGYDVSRAFHEGLELSGRLMKTTPGGKILYTPWAVLRHDYIKDVPHLLHKASMLARAEERVAVEHNEQISETLAAARTYPIQDGRGPVHKVIGEALRQAFLATVQLYRLRNRAMSRVGIS